MNANMRTKLNAIKGLVCAIAAVSAVQAQDSQILYSNTSDPTLGSYAPADNETEFGDQVEFFNVTGGGTTVTEFRFEYFSSEATGDAVLRFRANDGELFNGVASPSTLLYESPPFNLQADYKTVEVTGLAVVIPDNAFTFTIEFANLGATQDVGLLIRNPPELGTSFDDLWVDNGGDWALKTIPLTTANLAANIVGIVPEPGTTTLALMGLGSLLGDGFIRRKK